MERIIQMSVMGIGIVIGSSSSAANTIFKSLHVFNVASEYGITI